MSHCLHFTNNDHRNELIECLCNQRFNYNKTILIATSCDEDYRAGNNVNGIMKKWVTPTLRSLKTSVQMALVDSRYRFATSEKLAAASENSGLEKNGLRVVRLKPHGVISVQEVVFYGRSSVF